MFGELTRRASASHRVSGAWALFLGVLSLCSLPSPTLGQFFSPIHPFSQEAGQPASRLLRDPAGRLWGTTLHDGPYGKGSVYVLTPDGGQGFTFATIHAFTGGDDGEAPVGDLILGTDGNVYGVCAMSGGGLGSLYRIDPALQFTATHPFISPPTAGLMQASDGLLYGVSLGAVFRVNPSGAGFEVVHVFGAGDGSEPRAALFEAADGKLYGTTRLGGDSGQGTIFRVSILGAFETLHSFGGGMGEGAFPEGPLMQGDDGNLYGTTTAATFGGDGSVYRLDPQGGATTIHVFDGSDGNRPSAALIQGSDGLLYGTTPYEGPGGFGTIFRIDPADDSFETFSSFDGSKGGTPFAGIIQLDDGPFYGSTTYGDAGHDGTIYRVALDGTLETVHAFVPGDGYRPIVGLIQGSDGYLYGATPSGGAYFAGSAFRMSRSGEIAILHSFTLEEGGPSGKLLEASDGYFYGTGGGVSGFGNVFRMDRTGAVMLMHDFTGGDGSSPSGPLMAPGDGYFYGTTQGGGPHQSGTVFRIDGSGAFATVHAFDGTDGDIPRGGLVRGGDGALYGVTANGGTHTVGTVYRLETAGGFSSLHSFDNFVDGSNPSGTLLVASDGAFYGATEGGNGGPIVFRIDSSGAFSLLHRLAVGEGGYPNDDLVETPAGTLYGTADAGGDMGDGTIFRIDFLGQTSVAHSFEAGADGRGPLHGALLADDGSLYGTTYQGGPYDGGTVFRYTPPGVVSLWKITPSSGPASGGTPVVVEGYGPIAGLTADFGGVPAIDVVWVGPTEVHATTPALAAGTLNDLTLTNSDSTSGTLPEAFLADFVDVSQTSLFHASVEKIFRARVTAGCGNGSFCADVPTTRAQMAVFLLKAKLGRLYAPPAATGTVFDDVPADAFAAAWIEDLNGRQITVGCDAESYCPDAPVTRAEMAVFLLKTLLGFDYAPPAPTGTRFDDVSTDTFAAAWIEELARRGVTAGCSTSPPLFCPDATVTRAEMAAFLSLTFVLP